MIKKCLLPVAGYGTRFLPATKAIPKEMLPIVNKPLVQYCIEEAVEAGINSFNFVTSRGKRTLEDHFDISYELEHHIKGSEKEVFLFTIRKLIEENEFYFTRQKHIKGLGHAILSGKNLIGDFPFAVVLADDLCVVKSDSAGVLSQLIEIYTKYQCTILAIQEVPIYEAKKYGIIDGKIIENRIYQVSKIIEKPENAPTNLAVIGRYILTPDIFNLLELTKPADNGEMQIADALLSQVDNGKVIAYKFKGKRFDCGGITGFIEATNYVYKHIYKKSFRLKT